MTRWWRDDAESAERSPQDADASPDLPDNVSARWIARQMQRPWRDVGKHVLVSPKVLKVMAELGWTYRRGMGCKARSVFQRGEAALQRNANYAEEPRS